MSGIFRIIEPPPPLHPASVSSSRTKGGGVHTRPTVRGWGINISEDARHSFVSYSIIPLRVYPNNQKYFCSLHGNGRLAKKERIQSISDLFVMMEAKQERSVYQKYQSISVLFVAMDARQERSLSKESKVFLISSWQGTPGKKGVYIKSVKVFLFSSWQRNARQ